MGYSDKKISLVTLEEAYKLSPIEVKDLYKKNVNPNLVKLFNFFSFSNDKPVRASGCYIELSDGRKILDITGGIGVLNHGHNHPDILKARIDYQMKNKMEVHKNYLSPLYSALAENLRRITPKGLDYSFFPSSGSEAVEGCLKLAYKYANKNWKKPKSIYVLHSKNSFHGKLFGAGGVTGSPELNYKFPSPFKTDVFERDNEEKIIKLVEKYNKKIFALIYEPFSASLCEESEIEFLVFLRKICSKNNIPLIFDEVYTGLFKTGKLFNFMRSDIVPDMVSFAKSFGGGKSSIAGYITNERIFKGAYGKGKYATLHSTTYSGLGEEAATAIKSIEIAFRDDYETKSKFIGIRLNQILNKLEGNSEIIKSYSGAGALWAIEINPAKIPLLHPLSIYDYRFAQKLATALIIEKLYKEFSILSFFGSNKKIKLIISLPLIAQEEDIDKIKKALESIFINTNGLNRLFAKQAINEIKNKFS